MKLNIKVENLRAVRGLLDRMDRTLLRDASAKALNDTAFRIRRELQVDMQRVFDQPTPYIIKSAYVRQASPERLSAEIEPTYFGGKGVDPQKILQAQEFGGRRRDKRSEVALRRIGVLPPGYQTAIPATPYPGTSDGRGNLKGGFLAQLLSYFQAFGEQGYRANMTARRKRGIHRGTKRTAGRRYFVSYGRMRSGRTSHLAPGIWAASGLHSVDIRPMLMFVRAGSYRPRMSMERVARQADANNYLSRRMRYRVRQAMGV